MRGTLMTVHACRAEDAGAPARVGLAVPGRGLSAVARNRIKRRLRSAFDAAGAPVGFDFVVRATREVESVDFQLLVDELSHNAAVAAGDVGSA